jgi:hypothetical protein
MEIFHKEWEYHPQWLQFCFSEMEVRDKLMGVFVLVIIDGSMIRWWFQTHTHTYIYQFPPHLE